MHTVRKGTIGELKFALELLKLGIDVFFPLSNETQIDMVILKNGKLQRVQVKSRSPKNGVIAVPTTSHNKRYSKRYTKETVDILAIYDKENGNGYFIPIEELEKRKSFCIRLEPTKNSQKKNIRWASKYRIF